MTEQFLRVRHDRRASVRDQTSKAYVPHKESIRKHPEGHVQEKKKYKDSEYFQKPRRVLVPHARDVYLR